MSDRPYVSVVGPGIATEEEALWAEEIGRLLALAGAVVVCGGSTGVMEAGRSSASSPGSSAARPTPT